MEDEVRNESANGPPEPAPSSIGRRQLLQALGVAAGAVAATAFLPNGWVTPAVAGDPKPTATPKPKSPPTPPSEFPPPFPPTSTPTSVPTATPTPTPKPFTISNLSVSEHTASFSYSSPELDINDDNTFMHAEVKGGKATLGDEPHESLSWLSGTPTYLPGYGNPYPVVTPTPLALTRQATSAGKGTITFQWWPLTAHGVPWPVPMLVGDRILQYPPRCYVANSSQITSAELTVWLYTRSNTLIDNSSIVVCR